MTKSMNSSNSMRETGSTLRLPKRPRGRRARVEWTPKEQLAWKPPERLTVSEWADKYRILDPKTSALPGRWKTDRTPYLREVMDQFSNPEIEEIDFCCASQVGKTETINNVVGYIVDQDPNPALMVYPTLDLAEYASENRIEPMILLAPTLKERYDKRASDRLELQFVGMYLVLSGANSAASLASRPVRYILLDEVDKYPVKIGDEADPFSLAVERTKTFYNKKILAVSTPTLEMALIWQRLITADLIKQYFVPCPHCGHFQTLKLANIKWPKEISEPRKARDTAYYVCEECGSVIEDRHKAEMLRGGEWRPVKYDDREGRFDPIECPKRRIRRVGYQLNSIYSPWVTFGDVAAKFLESKDFPEKLRNFINSWLGEPWRDKSSTMNSDIVLSKQWTHSRGEVPEDALMLTAGVDIQLDHMWWEVRAWGEKLTSWLVDYGRCETWDELEEVLFARRYENADGQGFSVAGACIDSGYRTDEVYDFCTRHPIARPSKGSSNRLTAPFNVSKIDKNKHNGKFEGLKLYVLDTHYFKDFIAGRLRKEPGEPGAWMVFDDCPREYAEHLTAEQKVVKQDRRTGRTIEEWVPVSTHAKNHLLDAAVGSAAAAEILGVRYLHKAMAQPRKRQRDVVNKGIAV